MTEPERRALILAIRAQRQRTATPGATPEDRAHLAALVARIAATYPAPRP